MGARLKLRSIRSQRRGPSHTGKKTDGCGPRARDSSGEEKKNNVRRAGMSGWQAGPSRSETGRVGSSGRQVGPTGGEKVEMG